MTRIILFLAGEKGHAVLRRLVEKYKENIGIVVSFHEVGVEKDWYDDISNLCGEHRISFYEWKDIKFHLDSVLKSNSITSAIAISWRFLIPLSINDVLENKLIVFHDSLLPKYRGFAPVVTALLNGDDEIGATALFAVWEVDKGDIILQKSISVGQDMSIADIIHKMSSLYSDMAAEIVEKILSGGELFAFQQDESKASYSVWRDEDDYWIDWTKPSRDIAAFVRAVGSPYKGAKCFAGEDLIRIDKVSIVTNELFFPIRQPGKIWELNSGKPIVICGQGMLCIESAKYENGEQYHFSRLRLRLRSGL